MIWWLAPRRRWRTQRPNFASSTGRRASATTTDEQHRLQLKVRELERKQRRQRQRIFDVEDKILERRDRLIDQLGRRMRQRTNEEALFTIRWRVV